MPDQNLMPVIGRVPRLFHLLRALGDRLHADLGVTTAMRGVMASLAVDGPRTVPELARERPVSRQHIQTVVNELASAGLVESLSNPSHRRSVLIALTPAGARAFAKVRERETKALEDAGVGAEPSDLAATLRVMDALERALAALVAEGAPTHVPA